jgi:sodium-dependent dicarboxylate transporter 2/3/5
MALLKPMDTDRKAYWTSLATIRWGTIILFAGGIALGRASLESGLALSLGQGIQNSLGDSSLLIVTLAATFFGVLLSELTSNTAAAALGVPLIMGVTQQLGINPLPPSLGLALGTSLGFMMPISTPPNSIIFSSGTVSVLDMMKFGIVLDLFGALATVTILRLILPLMGWW